MKKFIIILSLATVSVLVTFSGCDIEDLPEPEDIAEYSTGWFGDDNMAEVPTTVNYGFGNGTFPPSVDLISKFPPIGNQNPYGTCVAWAVAYNTKTAINGMANGYGPSDLASAANQFSPKDFFISIDDSKKGSDCNGVSFTVALDKLLDRGVATLQTVPYTNLGDCSQSGIDASWTAEANQNKIKYYRRIEASINSIKENLANNLPVILGAKLADNFMSWNSDNILSSNTTYDNVGQHSYHALVIAGYDDNKGPNGAFRVINSWDTGWGDYGYIWIDYNFMINEFCANLNGGDALFIMANEEGNTQPPDPDPNTSGVDLAPWVFADISTDDLYAERELEFNIYNIGNQTASPESDWSYVYLYYNAYDADDYGIIFYDQFNTSIANNTFECIDNNCVINYPIAGGSSFAETIWETESLYKTYYMPNITGYYYLLLAVDASDVFNEQDEMDNLFYTTNPDPAYFENGIVYKSGNKSSKPVLDFKNDIPFNSYGKSKITKFNSAVNKSNPNAYTPEEIISFIKAEKKSGELEKKLVRYRGTSPAMRQK